MSAGDLLAEVGKSLFGWKTWRAQMADALLVRRDTIKNWELDRDPIPATVWQELGALTLERISTLNRLSLAMIREREGYK